MARLSRAETQERNRAKVLSAARAEFAEKGFRAARIDDIADRAGLTRGAVYSNFPGKRALYFAVLADLAERAPLPPHRPLGRTAAEALGAFAGAWVARFPPVDADERTGPVRFDLDLMSEVLADERLRQPFLQLMKLDALLLALALEHVRPPAALPATPPHRLVRMAETVLTTLHGASQMAAAAPGFVEPFDVVSACEQLAGLALNDYWSAPSISVPARRVDERWSPPETVDVVRGEPARLVGDGVVAILGLGRLSVIEQVVRCVPAGTQVSMVVVTGEPEMLASLARLVITDLCHCIRAAFPQSAWPRLQVICDASGLLAAAAGVPAVSDVTETAVRVERGRIVSRADGAGACHTVAGIVARSLETSSR